MSIVYTIGFIAWFVIFQVKWQSWGALGDKLNLIMYSG